MSKMAPSAKLGAEAGLHGVTEQRQVLRIASRNEFVNAGVQLLMVGRRVRKSCSRRGNPSKDGTKRLVGREVSVQVLGSNGFTPAGTSMCRLGGRMSVAFAMYCLCPVSRHHPSRCVLGRHVGCEVSPSDRQRDVEPSVGPAARRYPRPLSCELAGSRPDHQ